MLLIGTLYCAKGNYEFGISRVIKSLEPYNKKLGTDTWFYAKRCFLSLIENLAKHMISVRDSVIQVRGIERRIGGVLYNNNSYNWIRNVSNFWTIAKFMVKMSKLYSNSLWQRWESTEERIRQHTRLATLRHSLSNFKWNNARQ